MGSKRMHEWKSQRTGGIDEQKADEESEMCFTRKKDRERRLIDNQSGP
jgi:hypothetical protein